MKTLRALSMMLVALALAGAAEAQTPRAERPTWQVGDRWVRSDGAWDLVRIENDQYVFAGSAGGELRFTKNLAPVKSVRGQRGFTVEPPVDLQWPLKVGYVATGEVRWITWGCPANCVRRITVSVDKYETVTVPAGTFKAFRISWESGPPNSVRSSNNMNHPGMWSSSIVLWYAPEIGRYVKSEVERDFGGRGNPGFKVVMLDVDRPAPLAITVAGLAADTRAENDTLPFSGKVTSDKGVRKVSVTLNGAEVLKVDEVADPPKEVPLGASLSLRPGRNVVLVTATDASGETRQEARAILYEPVSGVALQRSPGPGPGGHRPPAGPPPITALAPSVRPPLAPEQGAVTPPPTPAPPAVEPPRPPLAARPEPPRPEPPIARPEPPRPAPPVAQPEPVKPAPAVVAKPEPPAAAKPEPSKPEPAKPEAPKSIAVAAAAPPFEVKISSPGDRLRVDQESIALAGIVAGGRGVSRVMVSLNGVEVVRQDEKTPLRALPLNMPIKLREGQNTLVVTAIDADGLIQQDVRAVEYARPTPLAIGVRFPEDRA